MQELGAADALVRPPRRGRMRRRSGLFFRSLPDHLHDRFREVVRDRDGEVVLGDLPAVAGAAEDAGAAAVAVAGAVELLVEPGDVFAGRGLDVAVVGDERPRLPLREERMREGAEGGEVPSFRGVGAEEDELRGGVAEVARFIGVGGRLVPVVEHVIDVVDRRRRGGAGGEEEDERQKALHARIITLASTSNDLSSWPRKWRRMAPARPRTSKRVSSRIGSAAKSPARCRAIASSTSATSFGTTAASRVAQSPQTNA